MPVQNLLFILKSIYTFDTVPQYQVVVCVCVWERKRKVPDALIFTSKAVSILLAWQVCVCVVAYYFLLFADVCIKIY